MPERVIRNRRIERNSWLTLTLAEGADPGSIVVPGNPAIVPLAIWQAQQDGLAGRASTLGIRLEPAEDPAGIAGDLRHFALIAVNFPKFADGRGFSSAYLLRRRYGWTGELRAVGDVGRDQIFYLERCGFDSFQLPAHRDPASALASFSDFSIAYQSSADGATPAFRRRTEARP